LGAQFILKNYNFKSQPTKL